MLINDGLSEFPESKRWLADYALLVEGGIYSIYEKTKDKLSAIKFLTDFDTFNEDDWLAFFLSPFTNFWFFENFNKDTLQGKEWEMLSIQADNFDRICVNKNISIFNVLPTFLLDDLRAVGIGSKRDNCLDANFLDCNSKLFQRSVKNILLALEIINKYTPGFYTDSLNFINSIALVDNNASFRGASSAKRRGLVYFSPDDTWDEYKWAEEIIHETTHCLLDVVSARTPLLKNVDAFEEKYLAPFRNDKRHLHGNYHALCVISRCIVFFEKLKLGDTNMELSMRAKIFDFYERGKTPYLQMKSDAEFTDLGEVIFSSIIDPIFVKYQNYSLAEN